MTRDASALLTVSRFFVSIEFGAAVGSHDLEMASGRFQILNRSSPVLGVVVSSGMSHLRREQMIYEVFEKMDRLAQNSVGLLSAV
jgi:hypothetical protein